ncbi:MAG: transglycosylase domain-containing protein [Candidatus Niyogibacteria bacterium]|nr:transglycosylase domain-containing protein [Candidatus Niyogibacteria bacterium]
MKKFLLLFVGLIAGAISVGSGRSLFHLPDVEILQNVKPREASFVYSAEDKIIGCYTTEEFRIVLKSDDVPQLLEKAIISSEDRRFFSHRGVDPWAILRAAIADVRAGKIIQGGSTITQQVAKNWLLTPDKTFGRKAKEALVALEIETKFTKKEILTLYVNTVFLGRSSYGFEAGARSFFKKSVEDLKIEEAAFLVGLINYPATKEPLKRKNRVLRLMYEQKYITYAEYQKAYYAPIQLTPYAPPCKNEAPYFMEEIRKTYKDTLPVLTGGLTFKSTLDPAIQKKSEDALKNGLEKYRAKHPKNAQKVQGAVVVLDKETAEIRAMVGGENFHTSEFNNAVQAKRQPGSAFKPFADAAYLKYVCKTSREHCGFKDSPFPVSMGSGRGLHYVENYPYSRLPRYRRFVNMDIQLAESRNAATMWMAFEVKRAWVRLLMPQKLTEHEAKREERIAHFRSLGYSAAGALREYKEEHALIVRGILWDPEDEMRWLSDLVKDIGIHSKLEPYLVTAIGASEVNLLEMTAAFISFVNGGYKVTPTMVRAIYDSNMNLLMTPEKKSPEPVFVKGSDEASIRENARIANNMKELLQGVVDLPTGTAHALRKSFPEGDIACKTGTATNRKSGGVAVPTDNWIICLTQKYAVGVWIGLSDKENLGSRQTGAVNALPIFEELMRGLIDPQEKFEP